MMMDDELVKLDIDKPRDLATADASSQTCTSKKKTANVLSRPASQHNQHIDNGIPAAHVLSSRRAIALFSGHQATCCRQLCDRIEPDFHLDGMAPQARDWRIPAADAGHESSQLGEEEV